jgi:hypothetical protein
MTKGDIIQVGIFATLSDHCRRVCVRVTGRLQVDEKSPGHHDGSATSRHGTTGAPNSAIGPNLNQSFTDNLVPSK